MNGLKFNPSLFGNPIVKMPAFSSKTLAQSKDPRLNEMKEIPKQLKRILEKLLFEKRN